MKNKWMFWGIFGVIVLWSVACTNDDDDETIVSLEGDVLLSVDIYEDSAGTERIVSVLMATEETYPCVNYAIDADTRIRNGELKVCAKEVIQYSFCQRAIGPATYKWELGNAGPGEYPIEVQIGKEKNVGTLIVGEEEGHLEFEGLNRIQLR